MITIECGIGTIDYQEPDNLKLKHLMEEFKDKVEIYNPENIIKHLDAYKGEDELSEQKDEVDELEARVKELEEENGELEDKVEELEDNPFGDEIDCGLGTIEYTADNLLLEQLMENLKDAIQSSTPLEVMRMLEQFNKEKLAA